MFWVILPNLHCNCKRRQISLFLSDLDRTRCIHLFCLLPVISVDCLWQEGAWDSTWDNWWHYKEGAIGGTFRPLFLFLKTYCLFLLLNTKSSPYFNSHIYIYMCIFIVNSPSYVYLHAPLGFPSDVFWRKSIFEYCMLTAKSLSVCLLRTSA